MYVIKQISIFLENKKGRLAQVTKVLGQGNINIRALSIADTTDFGILRLIVNDSDRAYEILQKQGFTVSQTEVVVAEIPDCPGALCDILTILDDVNVNVEYLYAFGATGANHEVLNVLRLDDTEKGIAAFQAKGIRLFSNREIMSL